MLKDVLRRFLSLIMCFIIVSLLLPATAMAAENLLPVPFAKGGKITKISNVNERIACNESEAIKNNVTTRGQPNATFSVGGTTYNSLDEAIAAAQNGSNKTIILATDGIIYGNHTIPKGIVLLIPFDDANTLYKETPIAVTKMDNNRTAYRKLTLAQGAVLIVEGGISVGGQYFSAGGGQAGGMSGKYGYIYMNDQSHIYLKNGGALYAWGFISGKGMIEAESGANVYEWFQVTDFRGGSATSCIGNNVFPFQQYYIQNIECALKIYAGAKETVYASIYAADQANNSVISFIGKDSGMFRITSGYITKEYAPDKDRAYYTINGNAELSNLSLKVGGMSVNSSNYVLPITNNITIRLIGGTVKAKQTISLLPGAEIQVAENTELCIENSYKAYVYDRDVWLERQYIYGGNFKSLVYSPTKTYSRTNADLKDAEIDINGKVSVVGELYSTLNGSNIWSSGGMGQFVQQGTPGTEELTYQYTQEGSNVTLHKIPITPAKLHNADGSYTETLGANAGTTFYYDDGIWGTTLPTPKVTVTFDANNGKGTMEPQTVPVSTDTELTANAFTREGHDFKGWNTAADGSGTDYADKATVSLTEDTTLYAQWEIQKFTVTWVNEDGTELEKDENVEYGTTPKYNGQEPTKEGDAQYTYKFKGWAPEIAAVTGDVTYTAVFEQTVNEYTVTWKNYDGSVLETDENVKYGTMPEYNGATPTKEGDAQYTYTFTGWTPEIAAVTGNAEYTAQFTKTVNKYTVTWKNWDGKVLKTEQVEYGATPEYNGDTPTKPTTEQYTYTFSGWDPDPKVSEVTGDATYTAQFTGTVNVYTITWKNWDGTVLETDQVEYGTTPKYNGDTPTKKGDAQYTYTFTGWTPEIAAVTGDVTYTAQFTGTVNEYTVTWKNWDGTVLKTDQVDYGTTPKYTGENPTKEATAQYTYTFTGWTPEIAAVTGDVTYTAQFTGTVNEYTVTWKNGDEVLQSGKVRYGETPKYNGEKPIREQTDDKTYTFIGWSPDVKEVNGNATYTAKFSETARKYKITWVIDGKKETEEVAYGVKPTHAEPTKDTDEHYSYEFSGWQPAITDVSGDATYTATFTSTPVEYTITFDTDGGTPVAPIKQGYDKEITAPAAPTKTGYTFAGWDKDIPTTMPAENMTITAKWTVNKYTITFDTDGGSTIGSITQDYGTKITKPADPTKTGYTFVKWDRAIPETMPAEDVTITAQWKINQYTITFNTDGGTPVTPITQDYGTDITAPADPTKTGHTFAGWDKTIPATMPAENMTITARWQVNTYHISFIDRQKEEMSADYEYGTEINVPIIKDESNEGYHFIGWSETEDGDVIGLTTMPARDLTLYARWSANEYTITFNTDGGTEIPAITQDYGTEIIMPADPTKIGYTFAGWDKDIPVTMPAENVTITAKWTINQYTIAFDTDGGSYIAPITQDYNTAVTAPENPSKTGYTFAGWDKTIPATMPAENMNITAQWTVNQYTITFDTDGGTKIAPIIADYGAEINAPEAPTKEGYVFVGWDKNIPTTMPAENLSIKAKWKAKKYNITWIVDGQEPITTEAKYNTLPSYGENNPTKTATAEYTYEFIGWEPELKLATEDATYTAEFREVPNIYTITWDVDGTKTNDSFAYGAEITAPAAPTKEGYTFTGWMIAEGEALPATMPAKNIVATAQWAKNKYKLTFEAEGYGGEPADVEWGTTIHAPASVSKEGHTLEGWYYTDGEEEKKFDFEADKMPMHDLTLTAKWTINQYTITFDTDGGTEIPAIKQDYGTVINAPEAPTKDGYTFKEWSPALPETMPAEDIIVTATYDYTYTGWITDEGGKTYLENGKKKYYQTWAIIEEQEYYFNAYGYVVTGWQELTKDDRSTLFVFDNNGVFQSKMNGVKTNDAGDIYWVENGGVVKDAGLVRVEVPGGGVYYYFDPNPDDPDNKGKAFKGSDERPQCKVVYNNDLGLPAGNNYKFGNDGIIEHFEDYPNGIYQSESGGDYYYCVDGVIIANGLMQIDGYYYYAKTSTGAFVCRQSYWITKTNGLLNEGIYKFDEQGRIVFPEEVKNGIVAENGSLYYYVDGKLTGAGLIQIDGDYYYVKTSNGEVVHGRDYWITATNNLLPAGQYEFAQDGKMINPPVVDPNPDPEPEMKNGIVAERGSLYYYVDGKLTGAGLIQIDGYYYYVKTSNCEVVHDRKYWITVTNDLLPAGQYKFALDGKMVR